MGLPRQEGILCDVPELPAVGEDERRKGGRKREMMSSMTEEERYIFRWYRRCDCRKESSTYHYWREMREPSSGDTDPGRIKGDPTPLKK